MIVKHLDMFKIVKYGEQFRICVCGRRISELCWQQEMKQL